MTAVKLQAETGHGSFQMIERRYFRHTRLRAPLPQLEYRCVDWSDKYGERLGQGRQRAELTPKLSAVHSLLPEGGIPAKAWEIASRLPVGTFYYCRDRLLEEGYVRREGAGRGATFVRVTEAAPERQKAA